MRETRVKVSVNQEESTNQMREMVESYDPEKETMVVIKVDGSFENSETTIGSSINGNHLVGLLQAMDVLKENSLDSLAERDPLKAILVKAMLHAQKND